MESQGKHHDKNRAESYGIRKPHDRKAIGSNNFKSEKHSSGKLLKRKATMKAIVAESQGRGKLP
jgi:hypothetical protein